MCGNDGGKGTSKEDAPTSGPAGVRSRAHARGCATRLDSSLRWKDGDLRCEVPACACAEAQERRGPQPCAGTTGARAPQKRMPLHRGRRACAAARMRAAAPRVWIPACAGKTGARAPQKRMPLHRVGARALPARARGCATRLDSSLRWKGGDLRCEVPACACAEARERRGQGHLKRGCPYTGSARVRCPRVRAAAPRVWIPAFAGKTGAWDARFLPARALKRRNDGGPSRVRERRGQGHLKRGCPYIGAGATRLDSSLRWKDGGRGCEVLACAGTTGAPRRVRERRGQGHLKRGCPYIRASPRDAVR